MRTIYLIRHGEPAVPGGERICLSRTDLPLSPVGRQQGEALRRYFSNIPLSAVYSSHLLRAKETAAFLSPEAVPVENLQELGVGAWEGLPFREIRQRYPKEYALRGEDPIRYGIPDGEPPADCRNRALAALQSLLDSTEGDIAVVAHAGVNRLILCTLQGSPLQEFLSIPQPCGCINILHEVDGSLHVHAIGLNPEGILNGD